MSHIVVIDMRESNEKIVALQDDQFLAQFISKPEAEAAMLGHILGQFPRLIIDLDRGIPLADQKLVVTVFKDGAYEVWGEMDAHYAKGTPGYLVTIPLAELRDGATNAPLLVRP